MGLDPRTSTTHCPDPHAAADGFTDIRVMGPIHHEGNEPATGDRRRDDGHIRQVGPTQEVVIESPYRSHPTA